MKKIFVLVLSVMLALSCLAFTACGSIYGEYKTVSITYEEDGVLKTLVAGRDTIGDSGMVLPDTYVVITLKEDGTGTFNMMGYSVQLTWGKGEVEGTYKIVVGEDEDAYEYGAIMAAGLMTIDCEDFIAVLKK